MESQPCRKSPNKRGSLWLLNMVGSYLGYYLKNIFPSKERYCIKKESVNWAFILNDIRIQYFGSIEFQRILFDGKSLTREENTNTWDIYGFDYILKKFLIIQDLSVAFCHFLQGGQFLSRIFLRTIRISYFDTIVSCSYLGNSNCTAPVHNRCLVKDYFTWIAWSLSTELGAR